MPYHEPEASDPLELVASGCSDEGGESLRIMTECFAEEFLRLGHSHAEVMALFRSSEYRLARHAWERLGEVAVFTIVAGISSALARARSRAPHAAPEASHA